VIQYSSGGIGERGNNLAKVSERTYQPGDRILLKRQADGVDYSAYKFVDGNIIVPDTPGFGVSLE
jgi:hypothetical protein